MIRVVDPSTKELCAVISQDDAVDTDVAVEQVPVLVAVDRSGTTSSTVLPAVNSEGLKNAIEPVVTPDILLVSDGNISDSQCAAAMGARHEALILSKGESVRGTIHIQTVTVNNRHSRLKAFQVRYNGVSTKYLQKPRFQSGVAQSSPLKVRSSLEILPGIVLRRSSDGSFWS